MCQIIHKVKNYSLPFSLIQSTCITNPDGFGYMMFDDKKLVTEKIYTGRNDPEAISQFLEQLDSKDAFLHFRFKTKGDVNSESCHPFKIYDGFDRQVYLMHNGTFSDYGSHDKVDSQEFGEEVVAPLYETFLKSGSRNPLKDKLFQTVLYKFTGASSKVVLMDNIGDHAIINYKGGDLYEDKERSTKFWVSNTYSFNQYHRTGTHTTYHYRGGSHKSTTPFVPNTPASTAVGQTGTQKSVPSTQSGVAKTFGRIPVREVRECYWKDVLELDSIDDALDMTVEDISDLVDLEPENAKSFIKDLLYEIYCLMYSHTPGKEIIDPEEDVEDAVLVEI